MDMKEIRDGIDQVDQQILKLFEERMELADQMAEYKRQHDLPVLNLGREREILDRVAASTDPELERYAVYLFSMLMDISRSWQHTKLKAETPLYHDIKNALDNTPVLFPESATVACQGVDGAYSQDACNKIFARPHITFFDSFDKVFTAVEKGLCEYGVLPIENSSFGSVNRVYDLMRQHKFHISRGTKLRISHKLLAKKGTKPEDIREIISHEQALGQCSEFLNSLPNVKITECPNTAIAAQTVADSDRNDIAAISSIDCARIYNLEVLQDDIMISDANYTRFICISKKMEIYPGSNRLGIMMTLPHKPMALYHTIARFSTLGVNLTKLESRPIPGSDFEFMFYFEMDANLQNKDVLNLICEMEQEPDVFVYLGNYMEV